ncbi:MAG: M67 family metallopeptidase [Planctomycetota bacterium]|nr:M67 family metallopeptidase [Planctomycetota bacterium]
MRPGSCPPRRTARTSNPAGLLAADRASRTLDPPGTFSLHLPRALHDQLEQRAAAAYPHEACGLLVGRRGSSGEVLEVTEGENVEADTDRYSLDPLHLLEVERAARERGLEVVGVWHSHPDHDAVPGALDRAGALEGWSYLIVSVRAGAPSEARCWRATPAGLTEERLLP